MIEEASAGSRRLLEAVGSAKRSVSNFGGKKANVNSLNLEPVAENATVVLGALEVGSSVSKVRDVESESVVSSTSTVSRKCFEDG